MLDDCRRVVGWQAMRHQLTADFVGTADAHVENHGLSRSGQRLPVQIDAAVLEVAGGKDTDLRMVAMGQRDAGIGSATCCCGNAGNDFEGNAVFSERFDLLAAASENERIAALQANDALALLGQPDQQYIDFFLRQGVVRGLLAGIDFLCFGAGQIKYAFGAQVIVYDDIRFTNQAGRLQGHEFGIAGAATDKIDSSGKTFFMRGGHLDYVVL